MLVVLGVLTPVLAGAYPLDGFPETGIRRLEAARLAQAGKMQDRILPVGALLDRAQVRPSGINSLPLPSADPEFSAQIVSLLEKELGKDTKNYGIAVLDISDPEHIAYGSYHDNYRANVGSVGKVIILLAMFQALADRFPDDVSARAQFLRNTQVVADDYINRVTHEVPIYSLQTQTFTRRLLRIGDTGSLWEYLDWMMSPSSNAAASMVVQQLVLMGHMGNAYPPEQAQKRAVLDAMDPGTRGKVMRELLDAPLLKAGFDTRKLRQASPFTYQAKQFLPGEQSFANPRDLVRLMALIEAGQFIDAWSSQEVKRLLYLTDRRTRYASTPTLNQAAVYFKSGSLYSCQPEAGFHCGKYQGNRINNLASLVLVESPAQAPQLRYIVALMSNVLKRNSALAHQAIGQRIHALIKQRHAQPPDARAAAQKGSP